MNRSLFVMAERAQATHRHIVIHDSPGRVRPLCYIAGEGMPWEFVDPDPASARPMCAHCLKAATRVADLADRQEGIQDDD